MDVKGLEAAKAYGAVTSAASGAGATDNSFANLLSDVISDTVEATSTSESVSAQALNQQADLLDVVTAVNNAEMAVETVVAIRDKVIDAYNDIIRMPI